MDGFDKLIKALDDVREDLRQFVDPKPLNALPQIKRCKIHTELYQELWEGEWLCESCLCEYYKEKGTRDAD